jgi:hypothetical protein
MCVAGVTVRDPMTVRADTSVRTFMDDVFTPTRHTAFPVLDGGGAAGLPRRLLPGRPWPILRAGR